MTRYTAVSLPGTSELASTTVSPGGDGDVAVVADRHPAQRAHRLALRTGRHQHDLVSAGRLIASSSPTTRPAGIRNRPRSRAMPMLRTIERPMKATLRSCTWAESSTCWTRCTWEANDATMMRPFALRRWSRAPARSPAPGVTKPGISALVESDSSRSTPGRAEPGEAGQVGKAAVQRQLVHLEVAGVQYRAGRRLDRDGQRVRDGVVDREELPLERAELLRLSLGDRQRVRLDAALGQLRLDQSEGELRADQRDVGLVRQQVGHGADVVLVAVGEHDRLDVVAVGPGWTRSRAGSGPPRAGPRPERALHNRQSGACRRTRTRSCCARWRLDRPTG